MPVFEITSPEGKVFEVTAPDGATEQEVLSYAQQNMAGAAQPEPESPSILKDVAKSIPSGFARGAAGAVMALPNLINAAVAGPQLLGIGIKDTIEGNPTTKDPEIWQPYHSSEDVLQMLPDPLKPHDPETLAGGATQLVTGLAGGAAAVKGLKAAAPNMKALAADTSSGKPTPPPQATSDDIRAMAGEAYRNAESKGGVLTPQFTKKFITEVQAVVPQTKAGKLLGADTPVAKLVKRMNKLKGKPLTLREAQEIDEFLGDKIDEFTQLGVVNKQGRKLLDVQSTLRRMIDDAAEADVAGGKDGFEFLKEGRRLWSQSAKLRDVEKIITRAEMTNNPATALKTGFRSLYNNPSRMRGFSADEKEMVRKAAESGAISDLLHTFGSKLTPIITTATGTGGLSGAAASQAASMAARGASTRLQLNRANRLANTIANNSKRK